MAGRPVGSWQAGLLAHTAPQPVRELGVPKGWAWQCVTTRLALRSQQAGARGRAPQARSAAPNHYPTPPVIGTFILCALRASPVTVYGCVYN